MGDVILQITDLILPTIWNTGAEVETINDLVEHTSLEWPVEFLQEKQVYVVATEVVAAGVPGGLWVWVELSPLLSTVSPLLWAAIGGGGGAMAPVAPHIEGPTGVNGTVHTFLLPWTQHSPFARVVVQVPVAATPLTDHWTVQVRQGAKSP